MFRTLCSSFFLLLLLSSEAPGTSSESSLPDETTLRRAALLAQFGEPSRAYHLLDRSTDIYSLDVRVLTEMGRYREADSLLEWHTPMVDNNDVFRHYLQRARLNQMSGQMERAADMLVTIDSLHNDTLSGYRDLVAVDVYASLGRGSVAVEYGERALENGVEEPVRSALMEALARAYVAAGRDNDAVSMYQKLARSTNRSARKAELLYAEYDVRARAGDVDRALSVSRQLVARYPRSNEARKAAGEILASLSISDLSDRDVLTYARYLVMRDELRGSLRLLEALKSRQLSADQKEEFRIVRARYHYQTANYNRAIELASPSYKSTSRKRESVLIMARAYRQLDRDAEAARMYEYFARTFPNDSKAAEALFVASRIYERAGNEAALARVDRNLSKGYPSTYHGRNASIRKAHRATAAGDYDTTIDVLSRRVKRSRNTDEAALYYLAEAYGKTGKEDDKGMLLNALSDVDPFSFYLRPQVPGFYVGPATASTGEVVLDGANGLFEFLDRVVAEKARAHERIAIALETESSGDLPASACIERGQWLLDCGFRDWGESELLMARETCFSSDQAMLELARIYETYAMPWRSVRLYQRIRDRIHWQKRREYDQDFRWLLYPTPFPLQVLENAARYDMPPHLVYAMMREESRFDTGAVSRVGALGLMQLMPETAKQVASALEFSDWETEDLLVPEVNLAFGVWYAHSLLESSSGNEMRMLAAYNAGPGNARRWFDRTPDDDIVRTVDGIDFRETRNYVRRIVESANVYHSLYFSPDAAPSGGER